MRDVKRGRSPGGERPLEPPPRRTSSRTSPQFRLEGSSQEPQSSSCSSGSVTRVRNARTIRRMRSSTEASPTDDRRRSRWTIPLRFDGTMVRASFPRSGSTRRGFSAYHQLLGIVSTSPPRSDRFGVRQGPNLCVRGVRDARPATPRPEAQAARPRAHEVTPAGGSTSAGPSRPRGWTTRGIGCSSARVGPGVKRARAGADPRLGARPLSHPRREP